ncbi:MAG: hypothetical protein IPI18_16535 [Saprospiraceae bacterium]|nr:hypothetical protein [Saprospiraceae bacterium]
MRIYIALLLSTLFSSHFIVAQQVIEINPGVKLTFPSPPSLLDTLGQRVYDYSDVNGYYACILKMNAVSVDKLANLDRPKFYKTIFESMQDPSHQCRLVNQSSGSISDVPFADFYSTCKLDPDFPDVRFKRLILLGSDLYIIDYWTYQSNASKSHENKDLFFNSLKLENISVAPFIPSAINSSNSQKIDWSSYTWVFGIIGALVIILFFLRKKPKK